MRTEEEIREELLRISFSIEDEEKDFLRMKRSIESDFRNAMKDLVDDHFDSMKRLQAIKTSLEIEFVAATSKNGPPNRLIG